MGRKIILTLMLLYTICINITAQNQKGLIVLDNYTIPTGIEGAIVGRVIHPQEDVVFLNKDTSELFIYDRQDYIRLKDGATLLPSHPEQYEIELQCGDEIRYFTLVKDDFMRNGVIANGGAWKNTHTKYNSLEALKEAVKLGCEASRCDVVLTTDGEVALIPELSVTGTADVLLEDCLQYIKTQNRTRLVINLRDLSKNKDKALVLADSVIQIVNRLGAQAWVEYVSFDYDILLRMRQLDATVLLSYLGSDKSMEDMVNDQIFGMGYNFNTYMRDPALFDQARDMGLTIRVWTVDSKKNMQYFLDNGVSYITTDEPELLLQLVSE